MNKNMKKAYRMFKRNDRGGVFYIQKNGTNVAKSLGTTDEAEAQRLLETENQAVSQTAALNLDMGKTFIRHADPKMASRTWQAAMDELCSRGKEVSQKRYARELKSKAFNLIREKPIIETTADDLKAVLKRGGTMTNNFLRRLHNIALEHGWIHWHIITAKQWGKPKEKIPRAITLEEHQKIIASEMNIERRLYYEMLWLIGAAQTDCSLLTADNVDWEKKIISYFRKKTGEGCRLRIGAELESLLKQLPTDGFLFPKIATLQDKYRAAEFCRRRRLLNINNVSLHSYRYSWAERAAEQGYPERFAQAALGHSSKAVHRAYAKKAQAICPPLETVSDNTALKFEVQKVSAGFA